MDLIVSNIVLKKKYIVLLLTVSLSLCQCHLCIVICVTVTVYHYAQCERSLENINTSIVLASELGVDWRVC